MDELAARPGAAPTGEGGMSELIGRHDWSATPLGPRETWPMPLRTLVEVMLGSDRSMLTVWGREDLLIYNDACAALLGRGHPGALGRPVQEAWNGLQGALERVRRGEPASLDAVAPGPDRMGRRGRRLSLSFTPVRDAAGAVGGALCDIRDEAPAAKAGPALADSEARFHLMMDAAPQMMWVTDAEGVVESFNRPWFDYTGASRMPADAAEVARDFLHPEDEGPTIAAFEEARRSGGSFRIEHRIRSRDGEFRWFLVRGEPQRDPETGRIARWLGTSVDIHDRREAEAVLRRSEARLQILSRLDDALRASRDAAEAMAAATELVARHLAASRCAYADVDADGDRFVIRSDFSIPGLESSAGTYSLDLFGSRAVKAMRGGRTLVVRDVARELAPADGRDMFEAICIDAIVCCPLIKGGRLAAMMAVHQTTPRDWQPDDIALVEAVVERCWAHVERVGAEARLRDSEARYRTLFESIESGFCVLEVDLDAAGGRPDYRIIEANPAFYRQTGFPPQILGRWLREAAPALEDHWYDTYGAVTRTGEAIRFEQGSAHLGRWFDVHAFRVGDPREHRVAVLFTDVSAQRNAQLRLKELNETLETQVAERTAERDGMWKISPDLMLIIDFAGVFRRVNPAWTRILGYAPDELVGHHVNEFVIPDDRAATVQAYETAARGGQPRIVNRYRHKDGSVRWISWTAAPAGDLTYATGRDITAEKERQAELEAAQEQLRQSQKMEAMGQLTGGVAHDFNNLLTPIIASLDMLLRRGLGSERERRLMDGALQSAERAKVLVQRLLAFARRQPLQPGPVDLRGLVESMTDLIASTLGPRVELRLDLPADVPPALADANQLEMALLNLAVNARDAMPGGGALTLSAGREAVQDAGHAAKLRPGAYVRLSVRDTGTGMDEATLARAVEPFFSTKGVGRGTGLGLSMVHGLASQLGGGLSIASRPGGGTTVDLWLPLSAWAAGEKAEPPRAPAPASGKGRALLVDDEDLVRLSTADILTDLGYEVVEAPSAEAALRLLDEELVPDLVVTDHLMPGVTGLDLARDLRARRPGLPVLIVSGYAEMDGLAPGFPRLTKPFRAAELARSLEAMMAGATAP